MYRQTRREPLIPGTREAYSNPMGPRIVQRVYTNWLKRWAQRLGLERQLVSTYYRTRYRFDPETLSLSTDHGSADFYVPNDRVRERLSNLHSSEYPVLNDLSARIEPGDTFFDVGAHVGLYTCLVGDVLDRGRVVAFEPNVGRAELLALNAGRNDVRCGLQRCALSDHDGAVGLDLNEQPGLSVRRGDDLVAGGEIPPPNVVKLDVEGAELRAVRGLRDTIEASDCRLIYCEIHPEDGQDSSGPGLDENGVAELRTLLEEAGYVIEEVHERSGQPFIRAERVT